MQRRTGFEKQLEPLEFVGRIAAAPGIEKTPEFGRALFLKAGVGMQTKDKLVSIIAAEADPVSIGERSSHRGSAVDEDAVALSAILDEESRYAKRDGCAFTRDAHVVE